MKRCLARLSPSLNRTQPKLKPKRKRKPKRKSKLESKFKSKLMPEPTTLSLAPTQPSRDSMLSTIELEHCWMRQLGDMPCSPRSPLSPAQRIHAHRSGQSEGPLDVAGW